MPELPEVEAARRAIQDHCLGRKIIKAVMADDTKVIEGPTPSAFAASLVGKTLISARRKGKHLWLQLNSPPFPSFQFGMTGAIYIKGISVAKYKRSAVNDNDEWPSKHSKFFIELDGGLEVSFTDKRRFAKLRLFMDPASKPPICELGPDALLEPMTVDEFHESICKKKAAIKHLLLDQELISGIGNWVADEVLYQARIHPQQIASWLSKESCSTLLKCIKEVLEKAVEVGADCSQFPKNWIFHSREKKPGNAFVDGKKIDFVSVGSRTSAYVPELQKLSGGQVVKAVDKRKPQTSKKKKGEGEDDSDNGEMVELDLNKTPTKKDETAKEAKSRRELKPRGRGRQPPTKQKPVPSDDSDAVAADNDGEDDSDGGEENDPKRRRAANGKAEVKKATTQKSKKPKKAAK